MRLAVFLIIVFSNLVAFTQVAEKHEIDKSIEECVNKVKDYKNKTVCYKLSLKKWDAEIDKYQKKLSSELYLDTKELIDKSHNTWKQYKKQEYAAIEDMLAQLNGDFYNMLEAKLKMRLVRNRAIELKMLYEALHQP